MENPKITVTKDGPYIVTGNVPITLQIIISDEYATATGWEQGKEIPHGETYALCRCGKSENKPFCDGTHTKISFHAKESTDINSTIDDAIVFEGKTLDLYDYDKFCALARYCHAGTWDLVGKCRAEDEKALLIESASNCPSGRLVLFDKETDAFLEPEFQPSIGLIQDPHKGISGPVWVKGRIPIISESGLQFEVRNRVTLCRCGRSRTMPFCDAMHTIVQFKDHI